MIAQQSSSLQQPKGTLATKHSVATCPCKSSFWLIVYIRAHVIGQNYWTPVHMYVKRAMILAGVRSSIQFTILGPTAFVRNCSGQHKGTLLNKMAAVGRDACLPLAPLTMAAVGRDTCLPLAPLTADSLVGENLGGSIPIAYSDSEWGN
jgi:hypothetical protein